MSMHVFHGICVSLCVCQGVSMHFSVSMHVCVCVCVCVSGGGGGGSVAEPAETAPSRELFGLA